MPNNRSIRPFDSRDLRSALGRFATGVTLVTTAAGTVKLGIIVNSFSAVSLDPPLVLWSLRRESGAKSIFQDSGHFAVHVLGCDQEGLCRHFASQEPDKFAGLEHENGVGGSPVVSGCLATFECETRESIEAGDHVIFLGEVKAMACGAGDPLIFSEGKFTTITPQVVLDAAA